ncbi:leukocyte surface antigen CD53-like isoform X1 [Entelurus aequoreus]|uniref:leukocyte surface antigen CD53-like isoform X1 n=1 Tax=Entelurus aequoreus TaxID=161455 RepID=UPI002B1D3FE2|nr:leukocyte surface antigen CD53-like isoform X1 [Entelurus aequoreus]
MDRSCVNCLKILMIVLNFLCWLCGAFVVAFGIFQGMHSRFASLITTFWSIYPANTLVVTGTIVTCVCYLGVLGAIKENRCMLISFFILLFILMLVELAMACVFLVYSRVIDTYFESDLMQSLQVYKQSGPEENQIIKDDFDSVQHLPGCLLLRRGPMLQRGSFPQDADGIPEAVRSLGVVEFVGRQIGWVTHPFPVVVRILAPQPFMPTGKRVVSINSGTGLQETTVARGQAL